MIERCDNCGMVPDATGHEDESSPYLARIFSVKRQEEMWVCYGCFIALMDSYIYRKARSILHNDSR